MIESLPADVDAVPRPMYASFTARARALVIDAAVMLAGLALLMVLDIPIADISGSGRVELIALFMLVFLYEPLLVWQRGATIGHSQCNLRVVADGTGDKPSFLQAFARYLLKTVLGLPSFAAMPFTRRHQALHDKFTHTTVQVRDVSAARSFDIAVEHDPDTSYGMPSASRRAIVVVLYGLLASAVALTLFNAIATTTCTPSACSSAGMLLLPLLLLGWLVAVVAILILGWNGRLRGAHRELPSSTDAAAI